MMFHVKNNTIYYINLDNIVLKKKKVEIILKIEKHSNMHWKSIINNNVYKDEI